ncbi:MAG: hypothetical protein GY784_02525 [Gammaproteobacteria bacterium]|nr:hypothetical protein [Gammaproteobacteria bacterium]
MSNTKSSKPDFTLQAPTLPKGGGAITSGFGHSFKAGGMTGGVSLHIGGLVYSSGSGNGAFGVGFGPAGMGGIARRTSHGTPTYDDQTDEFTYNGAVLVPEMDESSPVVAGGYLKDIDGEVGSKTFTFKRAVVLDNKDDSFATYTVASYRPRIEGAFYQLQYWKIKDNSVTGSLSSFWRLIDRSNSVHLFGVSANARIFNPADPGQVFRWLSEESLDATGICVVNEFKPEDSDGVDLTRSSEADRTQNAQKYLHRICSGHQYPYPEPLSFLDANLQKQLENKNPWYFETLYDYGEYELPPTNPNPYEDVSGWSVRPDSHSVYYPGFEIRTHRLCRRALTFHYFPDELGKTPILVEATQYHYDENSQMSRLRAAEQIGFYYNKTSRQYQYMAGIPDEIEYTDFSLQDQTYEYKEITRSDGGPLMVGNGFMPVDLYGEGISGFLFTDGQTRYYYRPTWPSISDDSAGVQYEQHDVSDILPAHYLATDANHHLMDITGNGRLDYVVRDQRENGYYEYNSEDDTWGNYTPFPQFPTEAEQPQHHFVDLTGDGRVDLVVFMNNAIRYYRNLGADGFASGIEVAVDGLPPALMDSQVDVFSFVSMAGDGKVQLVHLTKTQVTYWPSLGYGKFGKPVVMENISDFGEWFRSDRIYFADLDGDGASDIILFTPTGLQIYMNRAGNGFDGPISGQLPDGEEYDPLDRVYFADILGNGSECLVYCRTHPTTKMWYYDFSGGVKPYMVSKKIHNLGAEVGITHKSSVHLYLEDEYNGKPWITRAPFPIQIVSESTHVDAISKTTLSSGYRYRHAYYDGIEREFRGFGYSEQEDVMDFDQTDPDAYMDSPPALVKTWYHVGADDQNTLTRKFAAEYYDLDTQAAQLPDSVVLDTDGTAIVADSSDSDRAELYREAQIAMKGSVLRSEIYGKDGPDRSDNPYQTSEVNGTVKVLQAKGENSYAVVQVFPREQLQYAYERNPADPSYNYSATLEFDEYGHPLKSCSLGFPRRAGNVGKPYLEQQKLRAVCGVSSVLNLTDATGIDSGFTDDQVYLLGIPIEAQGYVLPPESDDGSVTLANVLGYTATSGKDTLISYDTLIEKLKSSEQQGFGFTFTNSDIANLAERTSWSQNFYFYPTEEQPQSQDTGHDGIYSPDENTANALITPIALGRVSNKALLLPWYGDGMVYDKESVQENYSDFFNKMGWNANNADPMTDRGYYLSKEEGEHWWVRSTGYLIHQPGNLYYRPLRAYDRLGNKSEITYDQYLLFALSHTDAVGNTTSVETLDYQYLQPLKIKDVNDNIAEVVMDAAGRVIASSYYGSQTRFLKDTAKEAPNDLTAYAHNIDGFDTVENMSLNIYDEDSMETVPDVSDFINNPRSYIQYSSNYFYYDIYAWIGRITRTDLAGLTPDSGSAAPDVEGLWKDIVDQGYIGYTGAIFMATRQLSADELVLDSDNQPFAQSLIALFAANPAGSNPVNVASLVAEHYPRIFAEDLKDIVDKDGNTIPQGDWNNLWNDMISQKHIEDNESGLVSMDTWAITDAESLSLSTDYQTYQQSLFSYIRKIGSILINIAYNDGFGRVIQAKKMIESGTDCLIYNADNASETKITANSSGKSIDPRWLTSGHNVYNNKGQLVKKYEPYFINTYEYIDYTNFDNSTDAAVKALVVSPIMAFDPLGRTTYVVSPKGFLVKSNWTPWEHAAYDVNDCFIDSPYFYDNVINPDVNAAYYSDELNDTDRKVLADPSQYPASSGDMSDQGLAYFKTLHHAWTPGLAVNDNRGLGIVGVTLDNRQFTADDFESITSDNAEALFSVLQDKGYIDSHGYLGLTLTVPPLVLFTNKTNGATTGYLADRARYVGFNRYLSTLLLSYQIDGTSITSDDINNSLENSMGTFYSLAPFIYTDTADTLFTLLQDNGYIDASGNVQASALPLPDLDLSGTEFSDDSDAILKQILGLWSTGMQELPVVNQFDNQGRRTAITDPRFVWNNIDDYKNLLFGSS